MKIEENMVELMRDDRLCFFALPEHVNVPRLKVMNGAVQSNFRTSVKNIMQAYHSAHGSVVENSVCNFMSRTDKCMNPILHILLHKSRLQIFK